MLPRSLLIRNPLPRGVFFQLFFLLLAGIFFLLLLFGGMFAFHYSALAGFFALYRELFGLVLSGYLVVILGSLAIGLSVYLLSYVFIGIPAISLVNTRDARTGALDEYRRTVERLGEGVSEPVRSTGHAREIIYIALNLEQDSASISANSLFVQVLFARAALFSYLIVLAVVLLVPDGDVTLLTVACLFVNQLICIILYAIGLMHFGSQLRNLLVAKVSGKLTSRKSRATKKSAQDH